MFVREDLEVIMGCSAIVWVGVRNVINVEID